MNRLAALASLALLFGCQNSRSKLDGLQDQGPTASPGVAADHSGDVETRLRRLEDAWAKNAEALDFLDKVYAQQKQQQQQQARDEHDPEAVFAVDIAQNLRAGHVEGPSSAMVTIIEAWDFA